MAWLVPAFPRQWTAALPRPFSLILCADDYALSPGVSRGIREALAAGRLTATGCMTNLPHWPQAAQDLKPYAAKADIGLHLNLSNGAPLSAMPVIAPAGQLPTLSGLMAGTRKPGAALEIATEIAAQLDAFQKHFGQPPDFVDGHQHVQALPGIAGPLMRELERRGLAGKTWLRDSADSVRRILARRSHVSKALTLALLSWSYAGRAKVLGFAVNGSFAGFSAFDAKADYAADFARYLQAPAPVHLVMCHPGHVDAALEASDPVTVTREQELAFLVSDGFWQALERAGAKLVRGRAVLSL